jgi:hypothetical protein
MIVWLHPFLYQNDGASTSSYCRTFPCMVDLGNSNLKRPHQVHYKHQGNTSRYWHNRAYKNSAKLGISSYADRTRFPGLKSILTHAATPAQCTILDSGLPGSMLWVAAVPLCLKTASHGHLIGIFFFLTSNMENLSQLVTQEDYLGLQVLRITHHCYGLALNTSRSPHKEASAWKSCLTPRNTGPAGISPAKLHTIVGAASRYRTP